MNSLNTQTLDALILKGQTDTDILDLVTEAIDSFENYHKAIVFAETRMKLHSKGALEQRAYLQETAENDAARTTFHNAVISYVGILNNLASAEGLEPVYSGTVSEDQPYRRELADAVLSYLESIIKNRL